MQGVRSSSLLGSMSETPLQEGFFSVWKSDRQGPSDGRGRIFGRTFQPPAPQARFGRRSTANHPGAPLTRQARNAHLHSEARGRKPGDAARPIRSATRPCKSPESLEWHQRPAGPRESARGHWGPKPGSLDTPPTAHTNNQGRSQQGAIIENQEGAGSRLQQEQTRPELNGCSSAESATAPPLAPASIH